MTNRLRFIVCALAAMLIGGGYAPAQKSEKPPVDTRLRERVNLRTSYFPFDPPESLDEWERRAKDVRRQIAVAAGQWPELPRPTPNATVHGLVDRDSYSVARVYLETIPGHYATGSLFRPKVKGRRPAVISPYGHWPGGRFQDIGEEGVARQIAEGAERYEVGGRHAIQARAVQLARMGCVVFLIDCIGYGDSQLSEESVHRPTDETVISGLDAWGFYSVQAELRLQNPLGVQLYDARCALDWLATLPCVDPDRLAVTGASGGATQTMMLCATDDRLKVSFPAAMVSTAMQGGCPCENACCLRLGTGNVEIAALFAPKPMGIGAANDWTREMPTKGFPELQELYGLYGKRDHVGLTSLNQFGHNYNYPTRAAMYVWMKEWLDLDDGVDVVERDFLPLSREELTVWDGTHPKPGSGRDHETELLQEWTRLSESNLPAITPGDPATLKTFRGIVEPALRVMTAIPTGAPESVQLRPRATDQQDASGRPFYVQVPGSGASLTATMLSPASDSQGVVVYVSPAGRAGVVGDGDIRPSVQRILNDGFAVLAADLLEQGTRGDGSLPLTELPSNVPDRDAAGLTYGYNRTLVAERAADLLALIDAAGELAPGQRVLLLAEEGTAPYAATAVALAGDRLNAAAIDTGGFRFAELADWRDLDFLPGAVKYGDLPSFLSLGAPRPLLVVGEGRGKSAPISSAYAAAGAAESLSIVEDVPFHAAAAQFFKNLQ
ncbi:hypothetical protein KOR34_50910 [Posidoniimonas corsicana]|uniref:Acetyl xylan esterase (AXE1) n=1 Tax=Posidoniimonas corsicana TaxID=1938618 RepID=A0A5C5UVY1_9BACT|nr:acetylxylan esterase [Posidoniimonas corsicana]TWT29773.1 hypothetical protein KOR34_50910 [Posidoniimonas corsicana]